jgi:hypothetical protein
MIGDAMTAVNRIGQRYAMTCGLCCFVPKPEVKSDMANRITKPSPDRQALPNSPLAPRGQLSYKALNRTETRS